MKKRDSTPAKQPRVILLLPLCNDQAKRYLLGLGKWVGGPVQTEVKPGDWGLGNASPVAQEIAKYGAALCIAALCTAFVFDYTFWLIVDPRMLSYFVLADHIETAVHIFGLVSLTLGASWVLTLVLVYAGLAVTGRDQFWKVATALALFVLCLIGVAIATTGLSFADLFDRATIVVMLAGLLVMTALGILFHRARESEDKSEARRRPLMVRKAVWGAASVFLFLTMADAVLRAWSIGNTGNTASTRDVVSLEHGSTLDGNVIRHVDRGVILRGQKDGRIVFVPKEQVQRIDHRVPTSSAL